MDENALPSKKPRFDARLDFELAAAADEYCEKMGWKRGRLVREAIAQYLAHEAVVVPLDKNDIEKLKKLARKHNRPTEYEGREAISQYLQNQSE